MDTPPRWKVKAATHYACIKNHFLKSGGSEEGWQSVTQNPALFNAAWRRMLQLPAGIIPPPEPMRRLPQ